MVHNESLCEANVDGDEPIQDTRLQPLDVRLVVYYSAESSEAPQSTLGHPP